MELCQSKVFLQLVSVVQCHYGRVRADHPGYQSGHSITLSSCFFDAQRRLFRLGASSIHNHLDIILRDYNLCQDLGVQSQREDLE